jgi:hypothetical protein
MVKVHGKGGTELSQPDGAWAEDYWMQGQFQQIAQPCGGMPTLTTHADGTYGQDVAFDRVYCGCGIYSTFGCDYLYTPQGGRTDPGQTGPWPAGWWNGWVNTTNANADNPDPANQCTRTGRYWPRQWPVPPRYQGVIEQINTFLDQTGCDDLYIVTHSNGGNIIRWGFSYTQLYTMTQCHQCSGSPTCMPNASMPIDPTCVTKRAHQLRVMNATSHVFTLHTPSKGSEAANSVQWLTTGGYSWLTGWIAAWIGTPYVRATQELTTNAMLVRNTNLMFGTRDPSHPWPTVTFDGIPLHNARWIAIGSGMSAAQVVEDAAHTEDYELAGAAGVVPFAGPNDGLVTLTSQAAVYTNAPDVWQATGQHDQAAAATFSGLGNNGINHTHARMGGWAGGYWTPVFWRQENTTPMPQSWPGPRFPAPGGPGGCSRQNQYDQYGQPTISWFTCQTWPVPSYSSHGLAVKACPDAICQTNTTRGYPAGADEAFWISAFIEAKVAQVCGPAITNLQVESGQWVNIYRNYVDWRVFGYTWGPTWFLVGNPKIYDTYAPNAGRQVCGWNC